MRKLFIICAALVMLSITSCNDGSIIGKDLLEGEAIDLKYDDNFELKGRTLRGDSVATYRVNGLNQTYMIGEVNDPIFGKFSSDVYTAIQFGNSIADFPEDAIIDSVVLELEYDTLGFYGDPNAVHNIEVFRVTEDWLERDTIYSDESFMVDIMPIGQKSLVPTPNDSITWQERKDDEISYIKLSSRINIRLDDAFGQELLNDTLASQRDSVLVDKFKGLYIKSTPTASSMLGLNFSKNRAATSIIGKLAIYYTAKNEAGVDSLQSYGYALRVNAASQFVLDRTGSIVEEAINQGEIAGEEYIYAQAHAGVNSEIQLPDLSSISNNLINSAQLVLTVAEGPEYYTDLYPGINQFLMSKYNDAGERLLVDDIIKGDLTISSGLDLLDGEPKIETLENGDIVKTITFNITNFVKQTIKDGDFAPKVVISPVGRSESPRRTIFYGTNHPEYPAKFRVAYTIN